MKGLALIPLMFPSLNSRTHELSSPPPPTHELPSLTHTHLKYSLSYYPTLDTHLITCITCLLSLHYLYLPSSLPPCHTIYPTSPSYHLTPPLSSYYSIHSSHYQTPSLPTSDSLPQPHYTLSPSTFTTLLMLFEPSITTPSLIIPTLP